MIVPQLLGKLPFIQQLEQLAEQSGAIFHEFVLLDTEVNVLLRIDTHGFARSYRDLLHHLGEAPPVV